MLTLPLDVPVGVLGGVLVTIAVLSWLLVRGLHRRRAPMTSVATSVTYQALSTTSHAARHLRDGLTAPAAARAARDLRPLLGVEAVAFVDSGGPLAWEGEGDHHGEQLARHSEEVLATGRTVRLDHRALACADPDCPIDDAILAPIVCDDRVVAALGSYSRHVSADLVLATEAVAGWVSTQVELAELGRERSRAVEAELRALRAQISPHFVYNSLAAIASYVRTDPERARELLLEFADFTRYSLRGSEQFATLADELVNIERYLTLEQARFGDRLEVVLLVAPEALTVSLPTLAVQPLVENAVQHGIEAKVDPGTITITAIDRGTEVEIAIEDDGVGADPQAVRHVLAGTGSRDHVGLANVDVRLRQTYGDAYGLVVETAPGAGTRVSFRVPKFSVRTHGLPVT
ncbi:sensor histidine kinase [Agilicoccus flavus]|uniref:sensor histidine kinase n=1 Tax=Agilicoccus flavus TaxID=2775968 RepID=UPI001CF6AAB6|nr:histidine kinase [Agilicoccus flavus]